MAKFNKDVTVEQVIDAYTRLGYPLYTSGDYNLNIFGIRDDENVSDTFNDLVCVLYKVDGKWVLKKYNATTDPGLYYRKKLLNPNGTAILQDGYYRSTWQIGLHRGKYTALVQRKPVKLWRDGNKDNVLDRKGKTYDELAGINIHHASAISTSSSIGQYSAGCQVIANINDWNEFISIVLKSADKFGKVFSYALFTESQFFNKGKTNEKV